MMRYKEVLFSLFLTYNLPIWFVFYLFIYSHLNWQEKEAKKEAFRKYLESSGAVDALTKGFFLSFLPISCFFNQLIQVLCLFLLLQFLLLYTSKTKNLLLLLSMLLFPFTILTSQLCSICDSAWPGCLFWTAGSFNRN